MSNLDIITKFNAFKKWVTDSCPHARIDIVISNLPVDMVTKYPSKSHPPKPSHKISDDYIVQRTNPEDGLILESIPCIIDLSIKSDSERD